MKKFLIPNTAAEAHLGDYGIAVFPFLLCILEKKEAATSEYYS